MQTLYSMETQENLISAADAAKLLQTHLDHSRQTLVFFVHFLTEVARYAEIDARYRAAKYIPTEKDLRVNTKIAGNELLWKILEHPSYVQALKVDKPHLINQDDLTKRIYTSLVDSEKYKEYTAELSRDKKSEKEILEFILTDLMLPNEYFISFVEERFPNWDDDADMVHNVMTNILSKPASMNLQDMIGPEKLLFARDLLRTALEKKEVTLEYIHPKLKNWDPERIAILDMILLRLGVCEFLYFDTIPPKVTINEYIDLAKEYSTQQSGQFINGILDNIHKELVRDDKMHKVSFKQS